MLRLLPKYLLLTKNRKLSYRCYSQLSKLSFSNLEQDLDNIDPGIFNTCTKFLNSNEIFDNSMSRINLSDFDLHGKKNIDFSTIPSWYERLNKPSSYMMHNDITEKRSQIPYRSFQRCYSKILTSYADNFISLPKPQMKELQANFHDHELPESLQQQQIKINSVVRKLSEISSNTFIIYKRLKIKRLPPPFYLHQQFLIHLAERNTAKLLDLYFDLPEPRPLYLKREEFEKFMSLLLNLKISGDHKSLLPRIVEVYDDIRENGNGIGLTPFEDTKYLSFLLNLWKQQGLSQDEKYNKLLTLKSKSKSKSKSKPKEKIMFCSAMWDIFLSHFPEKSDEILKMIANNTGLTRSISEILLRNLKTYDGFNNALELMKLKRFHLDPYLMDVIIERYIHFNKSNEAYKLVSETLKVFDDISNLNWDFSTTKFQRTQRFKFDVLNKTLLQLHNEIPGMKFTWLRYKFKPNPLTISNLAVALDYDKRYELLKLMNKQNIPLVNKSALQIISKCDFRTLAIVLELVNNSKEFNHTLHHVSNDAKYDSSYLKQFVYDSVDKIFELKEIFQTSIRLYDSFENIENVNDVRAITADQLVRLNNEIKNN